MRKWRIFSHCLEISGYQRSLVFNPFQLEQRHVFKKVGKTIFSIDQNQKKHPFEAYGLAICAIKSTRSVWAKIECAFNSAFSSRIWKPWTALASIEVCNIFWWYLSAGIFAGFVCVRSKSGNLRLPLSSQELQRWLVQKTYKRKDHCKKGLSWCTS